MPKLLLLLVFFAALQASAQKENANYKKTLADSLGADEYGMKNYALVILKTGNTDIKDKARLDSLFRGHMDNINRLAKSGKLVVAGPLGKNDRQYEGIFILDAKTPEEAKALTDTDPTIKAGLLIAEIYPWYGSAALPMYLKYHDLAAKKLF